MRVTQVPFFIEGSSLNYIALHYRLESVTCDRDHQNVGSIAPCYPQSVDRVGQSIGCQASVNNPCHFIVVTGVTDDILLQSVRVVEQSKLGLTRGE